MKSKELIELGEELYKINLGDPIALAEIRDVLSAIIDHLYFRQYEKETREGLPHV
jgi:hypothetical protein